MDRCDFLDVLEEAVTIRGAVDVRLIDGTHFVDFVKHVVTEGGQDWAVFKDHDRVALEDIRSCVRAEPHGATYDHKLGASASH
jgi:hypothetical protein